MSDKPRILVIEDNPGDVLLIRRALAKHNVDAEVTELRDGRLALEFVVMLDADQTVLTPDVVLVDLNLPRATGTLILAKLKQSQRCGLVPVIMMTSSDSPMDQEAARRLGADAYFAKPNDLSGFLKLGETIRSLLGHVTRSHSSST